MIYTAISKHFKEIAHSKISFLSSFTCSKPAWLSFISLTQKKCVVYLFYIVTMNGAFQAERAFKTKETHLQIWNNSRIYSTLFKSVILDMTQPLKELKLAGGDIWKRLYRNEIFWSSESCCGNLPITLDFMQNLTFKKMKWGGCAYGIDPVRRHLDTKSKGWTAWNLGHKWVSLQSVCPQ